MGQCKYGRAATNFKQSSRTREVPKIPNEP